MERSLGVGYSIVVLWPQLQFAAEIESLEGEEEFQEDDELKMSRFRLEIEDILDMGLRGSLSVLTNSGII